MTEPSDSRVHYVRMVYLDLLLTDFFSGHFSLWWSRSFFIYVIFVLCTMLLRR